MHIQGHPIMSQSELKYPEASRKIKERIFNNVNLNSALFNNGVRTFPLQMLKNGIEKSWEIITWYQEECIRHRLKESHSLKYGFYSISKSNTHQTALANFITSPLFKNIFLNCLYLDVVIAEI